MKQKKTSASNDHINTILGAGSKFNGDIEVDGGLRIDGNFDGKISASGKLSIGKDGVLNSESIEASAAIIGGKVKAQLTAKQLVKLESTAHFTGSIKTDVLIVEQGAVFNGSSSMENDKAK
ncbi:MAG: polymer-forming cytoskeletal protein [Candidatus Zixiibacteriota bacterium]